MSQIFINRVCAWAPGINGSAEWDEWALGNKSISQGGKGPDLSFAEPMFRRRLSQISKMTVQVLHDLLPLENETKIFFFSFRGELSRQYQINKMLIEEKTLSPALFSLSVFNAPVALATMALGHKGGYSALYPADNCFNTGLIAAKAALLGNAASVSSASMLATSMSSASMLSEIAFIYADEEVQPEYNSFFDVPPPALSFGLLLSKTQCDNSIPLPPCAEQETPFLYLKKILGGNIHVSP